MHGRVGAMSEVLWRDDSGEGAVLETTPRPADWRQVVTLDVSGRASVSLWAGEARSLAAALVAWADKAEPVTASSPWSALVARMDRLEAHHQGVLSTLRDLEADVDKIRQGLRAGGA